MFTILKESNSINHLSYTEESNVDQISIAINEFVCDKELLWS